MKENMCLLSIKIKVDDLMMTDIWIFNFKRIWFAI